MYVVQTLLGVPVHLDAGQMVPAPMPAPDQWWTSGADRVQVVRVLRGGLVCEITRDGGATVSRAAIVGAYWPEQITAADLRAGMHLAGTVYREVDGRLHEDIPVVRRGRIRRRAGEPYRVDVTWSTGGRAEYAPDADLTVLAVTP